MKDNIELKEKFLEYFADVPKQKLAAAYIGRSQDTITDWKKADPDFSDRIEAARAESARANIKKSRNYEWKLERMFDDDFKAPKQEIDITVRPIPILQSIDALPTNNSDTKAIEPEKED